MTRDPLKRAAAEARSAARELERAQKKHDRARAREQKIADRAAATAKRQRDAEVAKANRRLTTVREQSANYGTVWTHRDGVYVRPATREDWLQSHASQGGVFRDDVSARMEAMQFHGLVQALENAMTRYDVDDGASPAGSVQTRAQTGKMPVGLGDSFRHRWN